MASRLEIIGDWDDRVPQAHYQASALARMVQVSESTLYRYCLAHWHLSSHAWLERLRLRKATELIAAGMPLKEVSPHLGFKQYSHFSKCFTHCFGVTPRDYLRHAKLRGAMNLHGKPPRPFHRG